MESKVGFLNIAASFLAGYVKGEVSHTSDFRGCDVDGTDAAIGQCLVAIAHSRLSEIGRERDGSLLSYFHQQLR